MRLALIVNNPKHRHRNQNQHHQFLLLLATLLLFGSALSGAAESPLITIGPNIQVSRSRPEQPHFEIQLSADPADPKHLLGCSMVWAEKPGEFRPAFFNIVAYASFDGGLSWEQTFELPGATSDSQSEALTWSDPSCVLSVNNKAYLAALGYSEVGSESPIYRSLDGGRSFTLAGQWPLADREYITIDQTRGKHDGRVYVHAGGGVRSLDGGPRISSLSIAHSNDGGTTFAPPRLLAVPPPSSIFGSGNGVTLSDGTLVVLFGQARDFPAKFEARPTEPNGWLKVVISADGGENFSKAVVVDDWYMPTEHDLVSNTPSLAVDSSGGPFQDRLYAAWADTRSGRYEILFSSSADKGRTWSKPTIVNDDRPRPIPGIGPDDFMPVVAVNRNGVVAVQWYDRREEQDNLGWWTRIAVSLDGGETFSPSVKVSEAPFDNDKIESLFAGSSGSGNRESSRIDTSIAFNRFHFQGGDTAGIAADAGGAFHTFWIDNRTGTPQAWTSTVTVKGTATRNGDRELENLEDVTDRIRLETGNFRYDAKRKLVEFDVALVNTSADAILAPLHLRLLSLRSAFEGPQIVNADNQIGGPGALFTFAAPTAAGMLNSGERTKIRHVQVHFESVGPIRPQPFYYHPDQPGLVTFTSKVLSNIHSKRAR